MPSVHDLVLIIGNLIENAFDALKNFDGERIMNLSIIDFDKEIVIEVEDSGPGISKGELKKIFQRGYSNKGAGHGSGGFSGYSHLCVDLGACAHHFGHDVADGQRISLRAFSQIRWICGYADAFCEHHQHNSGAEYGCNL